MEALSFKGVSKRYCASASPWRRLASALGPAGNGSACGEVWALRGIDLAVGAGECVGVIGANGSGKSTLLRLAAGIAAPTTGAVGRLGTVAPVLDLGAFIDPRATGRENAALGARLAGVPSGEIPRVLDGIREFSGIGPAFDFPVRTYSSGMALRLAFSVATCRRPDILLVDEVLAVGDVAFQRQCLDRIRAYVSRGTAVVMSSHDMRHFLQLGARVVWLSGGKIRDDGPFERVTTDYLAAMAAVWSPAAGGGGQDDPFTRLLRTLVADGAGEPADRVAGDAPLRLVAEWSCPGGEARAGRGIAVEFIVFTEDGIVALRRSSRGQMNLPSGGGARRSTLAFSRNPLSPGRYVLSSALYDADGLFPLTQHYPMYRFSVENADGAPQDAFRWEDGPVADGQTPNDKHQTANKPPNG